MKCIPKIMEKQLEIIFGLIQFVREKNDKLWFVQRAGGSEAEATDSGM